jgi:hypothetical protein
MSYVALGTPRFTIDQSTEGETLRIPAQGNILVILFLSAWLGGWTLGGIAATRELLTTFHPFLAFWLCGWAVGWVVVSGVLSWMLTGRQVLRFVGSDLEIQTSVLWFTRRALYRGRDIRSVTISPDVGLWQGRQFPPMPLLGRSRGSVRFSYGARTHSTGFGLDDAEAGAIADWLRKKLPEASK